jgi:hypothetical protein
MNMKITSDKLAYWYLRLNGFLTIQNFVVHPDGGSNSNQRTDVDLLGLRFPYRVELLRNPMIDDKPFTEKKSTPYIAITEVKKAQCNLNSSWTDPDKQNMQRILRALGAFPQDDPQQHVFNNVAEALYKSGTFENEQYYISLVCIGESYNNRVQKDKPDIPQILWEQVKTFIYERFWQYKEEKVSHPQWDSDGQRLWNHADSCDTVDQFVSTVQVVDPRNKKPSRPLIA